MGGGFRLAKLARLRRRADFLRIAASGRKSVTPGLILQACRKPQADAGSDRAVPADVPRIGFTASRKVGIATARNRARRRLRAAVAEVMPLHAASGHDYVVIARAGTLSRPFAALVGDLEAALRRLGTYREPAHDVPAAIDG